MRNFDNSYLLEFDNGYLLEFDSAQSLLEACKVLVKKGYRQLEAFTPFPLTELDDILPKTKNNIAALMFIGGLLSGLLGYGIQYYSAVIDFPILSGGKPMNSWPAFLPVTFEMTILGAAVTGFVSAIWCNGLPRLHHPLFDVADFQMASRDHFFLYLASSDKQFHSSSTLLDVNACVPKALYPITKAQGGV